MAQLAEERPVFHSEADFQHAFASRLHLERPDARIRLEARARAGVRLDLLAALDSWRVAIEFKYLLRRLVVEAIPNNAPRASVHLSYAQPEMQRTPVTGCSSA